MASSIVVAVRAEKPEVSMRCARPSLGTHEDALGELGLHETSPPDGVIPPFVVRKIRRQAGNT